SFFRIVRGLDVLTQEGTFKPDSDQYLSLTSKSSRAPCFVTKLIIKPTLSLALSLPTIRTGRGTNLLSVWDHIGATHRCPCWRTSSDVIGVLFVIIFIFPFKKKLVSFSYFNTIIFCF